MSVLRKLAWRWASRDVPAMTSAERAALVDGASVLERDAAGPTCWLTTDRRVVKVFRMRRAFSSALWKPHAARFRDNAARLLALGVPSPEVLDVRRVDEEERHLAVYRWRPGTTLRQALRDAGDRQGLVRAFASFLAFVHDRGIAFRSFHFGNCLVLEGGGLGLIDVTDVTFRSGPLNVSERLRNFRDVWRYAEDVAALQAHGLDAFIGLYLTESRLGHPERHRLGATLAGSLPSLRPKELTRVRT